MIYFKSGEPSIIIENMCFKTIEMFECLNIIAEELCLMLSTKWIMELYPREEEFLKLVNIPSYLFETNEHMKLFIITSKPILKNFILTKLFSNCTSENKENSIVLKLYFRASFLNHSCDPNTNVYNEIYNHGIFSKIKTLKNITKGNEITIDYTTNHLGIKYNFYL